MSTDSDKPTYLYKLVPSTSPVPELSALPEALPLSDLDAKSGFIHLSTAHQVGGTLKHFFAEDPHVWVLKIAFAKVEDKIRWESPDAKVCGPRPGEGLFPHLYNGPKLGKAEIEDVARWERGNGWDEALEKANNWLVY
ncbi:uncharacterized protein SCHCODRAFT_02707057 [Schizophyllum commune H4-8]|nr:uncharacterized protein SCHCODRAFT_02707057 [Schizophyllum commune H4-8]KAI5885135.1 hypothetical protein SCHCODRAFT_02707057 [Schizophyllum commune H4-8]